MKNMEIILLSFSFTLWPAVLFFFPSGSHVFLMVSFASSLSHGIRGDLICFFLSFTLWEVLLVLQVHLPKFSKRKEKRICKASVAKLLLHRQTQVIFKFLPPFLRGASFASIPWLHRCLRNRDMQLCASLDAFSFQHC